MRVYDLVAKEFARAHSGRENNFDSSESNRAPEEFLRIWFLDGSYI